MTAPPAGPVAFGGSGRSLLVVGDDAELATALRDRLDRAYVTVVEVRPGEEAEALAACRPWPWMVVGSGARVDPGLAAALRRSPTLVLWRPPLPVGLPAHTVATTRFTELVGMVATALGAQVADMTLAIGSGVDMPDGTHVANATLEALIAGHPRPMVASPRLLRSVSRALAEHGVAVRPQTAPGGGAVLAAVEHS